MGLTLPTYSVSLTLMQARLSKNKFNFWWI